MSSTPVIPQAPAVAAASQHSNKPLLIAIYAVMVLVLALIVYAIIKSKQAKPRDNGFIVKFGRIFDPAKPLSGALCFVLLFAGIGGGYAAYHSFAGTCVDSSVVKEGQINPCVYHVQAMFNGMDAEYGLRVTPLVKDSDFGPNTLAAVIRWQKYVDVADPGYLNTRGVVDSNTWNSMCDAMYQNAWLFQNAKNGSVYQEAWTAGNNAGCASYEDGLDY